MPDSQLNEAEQALQHPFRKSHIFNGLLMAATVVGAYLPIRALPDRRPMPAAIVPLHVRPVELPGAESPLRLAGAWELEADDARFGGLSGLTIDRGKFLAVTDRGAAIRFDPPTAVEPRAFISDLREGPRPFGEKWARDAESLARDPKGRGWWVGYEQNHSLWLYDAGFQKALASIDLKRRDWWNNRGAEGLLVQDGTLLALGENGRDAVGISQGLPRPLKLHADAEIADAARGPDGSGWVLLREKGRGGISQSIAPLLPSHDGYIAGPKSPVPKGPLDNYEGMAIEARPDGSWRIWLVTDDGHRLMARTLLLALDVNMTIAGHDKGPATPAEPSKKPAIKTP